MEKTHLPTEVQTELMKRQEYQRNRMLNRNDPHSNQPPGVVGHIAQNLPKQIVYTHIEPISNMYDFHISLDSFSKKNNNYRFCILVCCFSSKPQSVVVINQRNQKLVLNLRLQSLLFVQK